MPTTKKAKAEAKKNKDPGEEQTEEIEALMDEVASDSSISRQDYRAFLRGIIDGTEVRLDALDSDDEQDAKRA